MNFIYMVGRPNVGKSYLFNQLCGGQQKVANYSGATTLRKDGLIFENTTLADLPGIYSLKPKSEDEKVSIETLKQAQSEDLICLVVEALKLRGQLPFIINLRNWAAENKKSLVLCVNMADEAQKLGVEIKPDVLTSRLKVPCFLTSAKTQKGVKELKDYFASQNWQAPSELSLSHSSKFLNDLSQDCISGDYSKALDFQKSVDRFLLSPILGPIFFLILTFFIFQSIFTWATPFMDLIESFIGHLGGLSASWFSSEILKSFSENAIFAGFGSFLVFTPQIFILTFIIGILEKSGYMARATTLCHKPLSLFGLNGKSFIPYMTGHACAIPAMYVARGIENTWIRNLTLLTIPLTTCSARLPVYALLIRVLVPEKTFLFGLVGFQGLALFTMYFFGVFMALFVSSVLDKFSRWGTNTKSQSQFFIMELPSYRFPNLKETTMKALRTTKTFIVDAGPIIFMVNAVVWALSYFPGGSENFSDSYMVKIGQFIEPVFTPLGLNWIHGIAIMTSFLAREVFVSTLGLLYGFQSDDLTDLVENLSMNDLNTASGLALLVFFAIALQCASTLGVLRKEVKKKSWAYMALFGYLILAYGMSFVTYQTLKHFI